MWGGPKLAPWYYYPDPFVAARLLSSHLTLKTFGTYNSNPMMKLICSYLGNHNDVIIEFKGQAWR